MHYLDQKQVELIHDSIIQSNELQGLAPDKSLDAILGRISTRMHYGMINDVYELAACYATYIAVGHAFNDANKRTGFQCMDMILALNGIELSYNPIEAGSKIVDVVVGRMDEMDLAQWLREQI